METSKITSLIDSTNRIGERLSNLEKTRDKPIKRTAKASISKKPKETSMRRVLSLIQQIKSEMSDLAAEQNELRKELDDIRFRLC